MSGNVSNHVWVEDSTKPLGGYWTRAAGTAGGAALVSDGGLMVGDNCANVSVGTTAAHQDLASDTRTVTVTNYHATQGVWVLLGTTSEAAADIVGTNGSEVGAYVPAAGGSREIAVHSGRTRLAYIGSGASTTINVAQGL